MTAEADTIVAVATPPGRGGIGVVRISGAACRSMAEYILGRVPRARYAEFLPFKDAAGTEIDRGIALFFPAPRSYTGEDVLELHGHGGDIVMRQIVQAALDLGARQARPGEFTERAFMNDKIDLLQAEAIADLVESASDTAARGALRSLQGEFSTAVNSLLQSLIDLRVRVEGALDFPDEEDINVIVGRSLQAGLSEQIRQIERILAQARQGQLLRDGIEVVIIGRPNVGKSSLINRLAGRDAAIVTEIPGTTRDPIRESCLIDGLRVQLTDTAGLRDSTDRIEQEGVRRASQALARADLALWVYDSDKVPPAEAEAVRTQLASGAGFIEIRNKIDLDHTRPYVRRRDDGTEIVGLSALTGDGVDQLCELIKRQAGYVPAGESIFIARERHLRGLQHARAELGAAQDALQSAMSMELTAEHLRQAQQALGELTGEFSADDLLGEIFARFCIGK